MNATTQNAKGKFVPTRKVVIDRSGFYTVRSESFSDGYHAIPAEMLCNDYVDEGGDLLSLIIEASGQYFEKIDYSSVLKCHVQDGVVKSIYTPCIMGSYGELFFVSGDNRFPITYDSERGLLVLGNLTGSLTEKEYDRADGTKGKSVSVLFAPNDPNLKVNYEIPFVLRKWDQLKELLEPGTEPSKELFDWLLENPPEDAPQDQPKTKALADMLMQTLGSGDDRKKLHELAEEHGTGKTGRWKLVSWQLTEVVAGSVYPPNYLLTLETFDGVRIPGQFYTNKALTGQLNSMGAFYASQQAKGRDIQLLISDVRPFGDNFAVTAGIQVAPVVVEQQGLRSAAVSTPQLPQAKVPASKTAAEFMERLNPPTVEAEAVTVKSETMNPSENGAEKAEEADYDPIPF